MNGIQSRRPRADARRNYDALLDAAARIFMEQGVDAPMELVAQEVGVGQGTLYRHFPTREHMFAAIFQERAESLRSRAEVALVSADPVAAFVEWLREYDRSATDFPGMSARLSHGLANVGSPLSRTCGPMKDAFGQLFAAARKAGAVRADLGADELLALIGSLPKDPASGRTLQSLLNVAIAGLHD